MSDIIGKLLIAVGLAFNFFGCLGLVRLPDVYNRLQAATKCVTLGTFSIMVGIFVITGFTGVGIKALFCGIFLLLTSSTAAHALSKGAYKAGVKLWAGSVADEYGKDNGK